MFFSSPQFHIVAICQMTWPLGLLYQSHLPFGGVEFQFNVMVEQEQGDSWQYIYRNMCVYIHIYTYIYIFFWIPQKITCHLFSRRYLDVSVSKISLGISIPDCWRDDPIWRAFFSKHVANQKKFHLSQSVPILYPLPVLSCLIYCVSTIHILPQCPVENTPGGYGMGHLLRANVLMPLGCITWSKSWDLKINKHGISC